MLMVKYKHRLKFALLNEFGDSIKGRIDLPRQRIYFDNFESQVNYKMK